MKNLFLKLLKGFEYDSPGDWLCSMFPSAKYSLTFAVASLSIMSTGVEKIFGLNFFALVGFFLVMVVELLSGVTASFYRKEDFSSARFSRFLFKLFYYGVLIAAPFALSEYYKSHGSDMKASVYDWAHTSLIMVIFFENMISILENIAAIDGKPKTHLINKFKNKIDSILS